MASVAYEVLKAPEGKHPIYEYIANLSEGSRKGAWNKIRKAVSIWTGRDLQDVDKMYAYVFPWYTIDHTMMVTLKKDLLAEGLKKNTINTTIAHVSRVLEEAAYLEEGDYKDYSRTDWKKALRKIRIKGGSNGLAGRALREDDVGALLAACARDKSPAA